MRDGHIVEFGVPVLYIWNFYRYNAPTFTQLKRVLCTDDLVLTQSGAIDGKSWSGQKKLNADGPHSATGRYGTTRIFRHPWNPAFANHNEREKAAEQREVGT